MNTKMQSKMWIYFVGTVFLIMLITAVIMFCLTITLLRAGYIKSSNDAPHLFLFFIFLISVAIGTVISLFVAKKILKPITAISKASSEIAKGNFDIRLMEESRIKEIRELNRNFNIMVQELSGIETLRNDFVVNVSHEFKTPIAAIEGYAMLLQDTCLSETERSEYAQMIIDSSRQLATLSGNILTLSKLEAQEVVLEKKMYRIDEQIRQAILLHEAGWSSKEINLEISMPSMTYYGNEKLLMQVFMNIIGNAVKFTPVRGKIGIQLSSNENTTYVRVSDNGCGMNDDVIKHIFDKFYQSDSARKSEGNGLGLALAKRIIELCQGEIMVKSEVGKGSTFTVCLPHNLGY